MFISLKRGTISALTEQEIHLDLLICLMEKSKNWAIYLVSIQVMFSSSLTVLLLSLPMSHKILPEFGNLSAESTAELHPALKY